MTALGCDGCLSEDGLLTWRSDRVTLCSGCWGRPLTCIAQSKQDRAEAARQAQVAAGRLLGGQIVPPPILCQCKEFGHKLERARTRNRRVLKQMMAEVRAKAAADGG